MTHSEFNASNKESLRFLQIWIEPDIRGGTPGYQQKDFGRKWGLTKVVTPTGEGGTLKIKQDASLYQLLMRPGQTETLSVEPGRKVYIHLIDGELELLGQTLKAGDGAQITKLGQLQLIAKGGDNIRALVFDLA